MGNLLVSSKLTDFQKEKLYHEFHQFYDLNGDGDITWEDFELSKQQACKMNGWKPKSKQAKATETAFQEVWEALQQAADPENEGMINAEKWINLWQKTYKELFENRDRQPKPDDLPPWLQKCIRYRFNMLDRTSDGVIDKDEFEYVMSHFEVRPPDAKQTFTLISEDNTRKVDFDTYRQLAAEYYFSNDPAALGNFINGKLDYQCSNDIPRKKWWIFE